MDARQVVDVGNRSDQLCENSLDLFYREGAMSEKIIVELIT